MNKRLWGDWILEKVISQNWLHIWFRSFPWLIKAFLKLTYAARTIKLWGGSIPPGTNQAKNASAHGKERHLRPPQNIKSFEFGPTPPAGSALPLCKWSGPLSATWMAVWASVFWVFSVSIVSLSSTNSDSWKDRVSFLTENDTPKNSSFCQMCRINRRAASLETNSWIWQLQRYQREGMTKIKGGLFWRRHESPRGFAPTPAPPAQNEKSSTLLNQHDQIEGVSYSALPENPLRAADRVSSLIKSCLTKTSHQIPVCFNLERIKKLPRLVSILCVCVWMCEQREAFIIWGRDICLNILLLLCDQRFSAEFFWNLLSVKDL